MRRFLFAAAAVAITATTAHAQRRTDSIPRDTVRLTPIVVTATRRAVDVFNVPVPVSVLDRATIRERVPNSVSDLFRGLPGLDVSGIGANQVRPVIRGQRGARILLLTDGIRLSNSRRQQDFGEIPALVDISAVERVEVVRGPASVLYGSDAIGGVINIITNRSALPGLHGSAGYRYSGHDDQQRVVGSVAGKFGDLTVRARGSYRDTDPYSAPAGSFGNITLANDVRVEDSGVQDESFDGYLGYDLSSGQDVFVKYERYSADSAGFGFVDPAAFSPGDPLVQIRYPRQRFDKVTAGYRGIGVTLPFADRVDAVAYWQDNDRLLNFDLQIPTGGAPGPDSVVVNQRNVTSIETVGGRLEFAKLIGSAVTLTYGVDFFRDATTNTDTSMSATYFAAPPFPGGPTVFEDPTVTTPNVPNARFRSIGAFVQSEIAIAPRATVILGARYQDVNASTRETPGLTGPTVSATDRTVVGAANVIVGLTNRVSVLGSVGRAFRSPNLIERFFNGPIEGLFQVPNTDLEAETSFNVDLGLRYRDSRFYFEGFVFQNQIFDGIRSQATGDTVATLPAFTNVNVEELRARGVELNGDVQLPLGFGVGAHFTHLDTQNVTEDQNSPIGDGFSTQIGGFLRYRAPSGRFFGEYTVRHNGERDDSEILSGNPIGTTLPAFTVHSLRAGVTVFRRGTHAHRVTVAVRNLTNELYAEFANASFFRPEPGRHLVVAYDLTF